MKRSNALDIDLFLFCFNITSEFQFISIDKINSMQIRKMYKTRRNKKFSVAEPKLFFFGSGSFSAPPLSITSAPAPVLAPAPAPALYCHLKLYYNSSTIRNKSLWRFFFPSIQKTDYRQYLLRRWGSLIGSMVHCI